MSTATLEKPKLDALAELARKKKLTHAHVLAAAIFRHYAGSNGQRSRCGEGLSGGKTGRTE